ncbi:MAG TPA: cytochrome c peroxidase [Gemmatimonadales bacterium]|nr:cytochrome c peroxidase [Gemmatimonadales bacterium]
MRSNIFAVVALVAAGGLGLTGCRTGPAARTGPGAAAHPSHLTAADSSLLAQARALFKPLPASMATAAAPTSRERVTLGRALFFDPRVSLDGTVSCSRCHQPALYGTDGLALPIGVQSRVNPRNAPTVLNAALQFVEHWRGDRTSVEDQATRALIGPPSFGLPDYATAVARLKTLGYESQFRSAFPGDSQPVTAENWGKAIGAYERTLVTPSPFDAFLAGDPAALDPPAKAGLQKFIGFGCTSCHNGVGVGGGLYQKFGLVKPYWTATGSAHVDQGRADVTHNSADQYVFKVPSLRNVAMTPPYFHDGSVATLSAAVHVMGEVQLGRQLAAADVDDLAAFLRSLTGPLPDQFVQAPVLTP